MKNHVEFWLIATAVAALVWRRWRHHLHRRRRPARARAAAQFTRRDLDRAYRAGHDTGAALGPTDETRRRWRREGFEARS